jgi:hypothetical protein
MMHGPKGHATQEKNNNRATRPFWLTSGHLIEGTGQTQETTRSIFLDSPTIGVNPEMGTG